MHKLILLLSVFSVVTGGSVYISRVKVESNAEYGNVSIKYTHDAKGNSVTNGSFTTCVTTNQIVIYFKVMLAEDKNDVVYKKELLRTSVDMDKLFRGLQSSKILKSYIDALKKSMDFEWKLPLAPVSSRTCIKIS